MGECAENRRTVTITTFFPDEGIFSKDQYVSNSDANIVSSARSRRGTVCYMGDKNKGTDIGTWECYSCLSGSIYFIRSAIEALTQWPMVMVIIRLDKAVIISFRETARCVR